MYECEGKPKHFVEAVLYIIHADLVGKPKRFINRFSIKGAAAHHQAALEDFDD